VEETLPWLDPSVPDDRMLASTVEAMRTHPRSTVALVTGDISLQNKATFARVPFLEPPAGADAGDVMPPFQGKRSVRRDS
jgi:hypothetical protein